MPETGKFFANPDDDPVEAAETDGEDVRFPIPMRDTDELLLPIYNELNRDYGATPSIGWD